MLVKKVDIYTDFYRFSSNARCCRPGEPIDFRRHDEVVLVETLDLVSAQRHAGYAPAEADIRMVAFGLGELAHLLHK